MNRCIRRGLAATAVVAAMATASIAGLGIGAHAATGSTTTDTVPPDGPQDPDPTGWPDTVTVTGSGSVNVAPDVATINLGVQAFAPTSTDAMNQLGEQSQQLTDALETAGVAPEDLQTSGLSLWSRTDDEGRQVVGYEASLQVTATVRDLDQLGAIIDDAQQAVGDGFTIGGVSFSFADPETVLEQARIDAFESAQTKAAQYAAAAGVELGSVLSIAEGSSVGPVPYPTMAAADAVMETRVSVSPGSLDLEVRVTGTFAIAN
ncbi:SIMPL domain-containing protein [soil metagenome]